jgi:hypothetical protein
MTKQLGANLSGDSANHVGSAGDEPPIIVTGIPAPLDSKGGSYVFDVGTCSKYPITLMSVLFT